MTNQKMPEDPQGWAKYLIEQTLPATPAIGKQLLTLLKKASPSYTQLAELISIDPVLSYLVMAHANQAAELAPHHEVPTSPSVQHAISMIGVEALNKIVSKVAYFRPDATNIRHFYYLRTLNTSLFAAFLAREIAKAKSSLNEPALFWGALYYAVPQWYLWRFATPEMRLIRYAIRYNEKFGDQAEREILGCTNQEITLALARQLPLPSLSAEALRPENQIEDAIFYQVASQARDDMPPVEAEDRRLSLLIQTPVFVVSLCNRLAQSATFDWYSEHTLKLQQVLATLMGLTTPKAVALTHQIAVAMSRQYAYDGVMTPAAKLFLPPREYIEVNSFDDSALESLLSKSDKAAQYTIKLESRATEETPPLLDEPLVKQSKRTILDETSTTYPSEAQRVIPESAEQQAITENAPSRQANETIDLPRTSQSDRKRNWPLYNTVLAKLNQFPEEFADLHEIMNTAALTIGYGLGIKRCTVALVNNTKTRLKAYYSAGTLNDKALAQYQLDLTKPSLFTRLVEAPAGIWVKPTSNRSTWAMIPDEFKRTSGAKEFFLMSIFLAKKPVAVFYADTGGESLPLTEEEYMQFKAICNAVSRCLLAHTHLKKKVSDKEPQESPENEGS